MNFVILRSFDNYIYANIVLGRLESEGVHAFLRDEYTVTIDPILTNAIGGIKLTVKEEDESRARELLEKFDLEKRQHLVCPNCGSHNVEFISSSRKAVNWFSALLGFFLASFALSVEKRYHCFNCNYEFEELPESEEEKVGQN